MGRPCLIFRGKRKGEIALSSHVGRFLASQAVLRGGSSFYALARAKKGTPRTPMTREEEVALFVERFSADPKLWSLLDDAMPTWLGPWEYEDYKDKKSNIAAMWVRRFSGKFRVAAQVIQFKMDPKVLLPYQEPGSYTCSLRSAENPEYGMVDHQHNVSGWDEGKAKCDEELSRRGYLLVD